MSRAALLERLVGEIQRIRREHPVRVAVDGFSTAGKTTFADALAETLRSAGREVVRAELDDFHRPDHKFRSMRGEWTPSLYLAEGYDWRAFRSMLLEPISPGGSMRCRTGVFDSFRNEPLAEVWTQVDADSVVVVDGMYLLRGDLADAFDYRIWLEVSPDTVLARACARDVAWVGSVDAVRARYEGFWLPAHARYEAECRPRGSANVEIDNERFDDPRVVQRAGPGSGGPQ